MESASVWNCCSLARSAASARFRSVISSRCDIDSYDFAVAAAQRMPIGDPQALIDLIGPLARDLYSRDRFSADDNRAHDRFDRVSQARNTLANGAAQMTFNRDATYSVRRWFTWR